MLILICNCNCNCAAYLGLCALVEFNERTRKVHASSGYSRYSAAPTANFSTGGRQVGIRPTCVYCRTVGCSGNSRGRGAAASGDRPDLLGCAEGGSVLTGSAPSEDGSNAGGAASATRPVQRRHCTPNAQCTRGANRRVTAIDMSEGEG